MERRDMDGWVEGIDRNVWMDCGDGSGWMVG